MSRIWLFSDGSVNPQTNVGYGAYVSMPENTPFDAINTLHVKVHEFPQTSSTKLELQTLLWALEEVKGCADEIVIYTDSQNIIGLPKRRERFETCGYLTQKQTLIAHHLLYKAFYAIMDAVPCTLVKVKGHQRAEAKNELDFFFTLVDRASREALRKSAFFRQ